MSLSSESIKWVYQVSLSSESIKWVYQVNMLPSMTSILKLKGFILL